MKSIDLQDLTYSVIPEELQDLIDDLYKLIQKTYLADNRPWVIGYSGGKDSSVTLQAVWYALKTLPKEKLTKPVYVISSDTFVEAPPITQYITNSILTINKSAFEQDLPFKASLVTPEIEDSFWVNLIGKGYPAPYSRFRWCTDRLKIQPANKFIKEKVATYGEVVVVLGVRKDESSNRAGHMNKRNMIGASLSRHKELPNAFVFSPIEDWYTDEVWRYLLSTPSPWGGDNQKLAALYKSAQDGECPLIIDKDQPSCGNSRFGCWVCTVVQKDASMEAMVNKGDEWMRPLLDFRDWLVQTQNPEVKPAIRDHRRRTGKVQARESNGEQKIIWGPFKLSFRQEILKRLLETENEIRKDEANSDVFLITDEELLEIRHLWRFTEGDWTDSLPELVNSTTSRQLNIPKDDWSGMGNLELEVLTEVCGNHELPLGLLTELFDAERTQYGMSRRSKIFDNIDSILRKDWRTQEDVFAEYGIEEYEWSLDSNAN